MDNFKAIYRILSALEKAMDLPAFDVKQIGPEALGVSEERWARYIQMLSEAEYIDGARVTRCVDGSLMVSTGDVRITLKGLEYLQENSIMQRIYKAAKGIKDVIPGL